MDVAHYLLVCLLSSLPGPPGVSIEDAYVQLFPVDKTKCPTIDPVRDISYELYTSENPLQSDDLRIGDDDALSRSHFDFNKPTVIFFHAFFESSTALSAVTIRTAFLQRKDHNVILLNAMRIEAGPWYLTAARNTRVVGEYTAKFIDYLVSRGLHLPSLHLVGLSLGAQMAGVCGQNVKSGRIQRITGLDPAGPLFTKWPRSLKLDKGDAEFVDVIHTDAGIFGYPWSIGHVDFWPNGGISPQPGCRIYEVKARSPDSIVEPFFCSHWRSYMFFAESVVTPDSFLAVPCKNWKSFAKGNCDEAQPVNMGYGVDFNARGNYYLATRNASPFSLQTPKPAQPLQKKVRQKQPQGIDEYKSQQQNPFDLKLQQYSINNIQSTDYQIPDSYDYESEKVKQNEIQPEFGQKIQPQQYQLVELPVQPVLPIHEEVYYSEIKPQAHIQYLYLP